jgi:hypothetical protein
MTATALKCGQAVTLRIETGLVRNYYIPTHPDDDGVGLVTALLADLHSALAEEIPAVHVSHGSWLSVFCEIVVQRRNRILPEIIPVRFLLGPCLASNPSITISCEKPTLTDKRVPF